MKILIGLFLLLVFIPTASFAGNGSGNVSNVISSCMNASGLATSQIGLTNGDVTKIKVLVSSPVDNTPGHFYTFHDMSAMSASQYQVGAGKKFYGMCMCLANGQYATNAGDPVIFQHGEGTAALAANGTATAPTGVLYQTGVTSLIGWAIAVVKSTNGTSTGPFCQSVPYVFDGSDFPFIQQVTAGGQGQPVNVATPVYAIGIEQ